MTRAAAANLSTRQLAYVRSVSAGLPEPVRQWFLASIADNLRGTPTDTAVEAAINNAFDRIYALNNHNVNNEENPHHGPTSQV
jgi:hypothetical protein